MSRLRAPLRRFGGALTLAFAVAFAAGAAVTVGGTLLARARELRALAAEQRFYVVARGPLAEATRDGLARQPEMQIRDEHSIDQLLGETAAARNGSELLRVLEVAVSPRPSADELPAVVAELQQIEGVIEAIGLGDALALAAPDRARRLAALGGILVVFGCAIFAGGVLVTAFVAVRARAQEVAVRYLLGADPVSLWRPFGIVLGLTALAGALGSLVFSVIAIQALASSDVAAAVPGSAGVSPMAKLVLAAGVLAFVVGAVGSAALAARRAVQRLTADSMRLAALSGLVLLGALPASGRAATVPSDWQMLRSVSRDLAACRRGLHEAEKGLAGTEIAALRALARDDAVLLRVAVAQREADARLVERWELSCEALADKRAELRLLHRAGFALGPPIEPRRRPVPGAVAVAFGEAGHNGHPRAFRNGVALRTRPGETVRATAPGRVVFSGDLAGAGRVVVLSHGRRTFSVYGRVAEALVVRGMEVEVGEPVARVGKAPGLLYFSIRERGKAIDPVGWLRGDEPRESGRG